MMNEKDKRTSKKYSVLIFGAGGRQTIPVCRGFHEIGCHVIAYCESKLDTGYLSRFVDERILFASSKLNGEDFYTCGHRLICQGNYSLVVPLGDQAATYLSKNKNELSRYSRIAVNDWDVFQYAIDKSKTMQVCNDNNIPSPQTLRSNNPLHDVDEGTIGFPVVVKPCTGVGSIGFNIIRDRDTLARYLMDYDDSNGPVLVQEYIEQGDSPQYRVDLFRDRTGTYKAAIAGKVTRWYPLDGGSGIYAETIHAEEMINDCKQLLDIIHWNGYANIDLVWDSAQRKAKILEINGRTGATIMLDFVAGINISRLILENELALPVTDMTEYPDGKSVSCLLPDLLWFLTSDKRFTTKPSWFCRWRAKDTIFSFDDPKPFFGFLLTSIRSYSSSMKKRKRI